jgi:hypothetical protein
MTETFKISSQQRKYYFAVMVQDILKFYEKNPGQFLLDLSNVVRADTTSEFVHEFMKMWFNRGQSTSKLAMPATDWFEMITAAFAERGLSIPKPNEIDAETLAELYKQYQERDFKERI